MNRLLRPPKHSMSAGLSQGKRCQCQLCVETLRALDIASLQNDSEEQYLTPRHSPEITEPKQPTLSSSPPGDTFLPDFRLDNEMPDTSKSFQDLSARSVAELTKVINAQTEVIKAQTEDMKTKLQLSDSVNLLSRIDQMLEAQIMTNKTVAQLADLVTGMLRLQMPQGPVPIQSPAQPPAPPLQQNAEVISASDPDTVQELHRRGCDMRPDPHLYHQRRARAAGGHDRGRVNETPARRRPQQSPIRSPK